MRAEPLLLSRRPLGAKRTSHLTARLCGAGLIFALALALPLSASAKDEFETAFKFELGRIAAHHAAAIGSHVLGHVIVGGYGHHDPHYANDCDDDHHHHHHHQGYAPGYGYTYYGAVPYGAYYYKQYGDHDGHHYGGHGGHYRSKHYSDGHGQRYDNHGYHRGHNRGYRGRGHH